MDRARSLLRWHPADFWRKVGNELAQSGIALDPQGQPHVAFIVEGISEDALLYHGHRTPGGAWTTDVVHNLGTYPRRHTAISVNENGRVTIACDEALYQSSGVGWQKIYDFQGRITALLTRGDEIFLAIGSSGIEFRHYDGTTWAHRPMYADSTAPDSVSLAFDPAGNVVMGYGSDPSVWIWGRI